jgi:hypothetical protein
MSQKIRHNHMRYDHLKLSLFRHTGRVAAVVLLAAVPISAQNARAGSGQNEIFVGSELESYLRVLQLRGQTELYPWSIRSFSPLEVDRIMPRDSAHPWAGRYDLEQDTTAKGIQVGIVSPRSTTIFNSAFPFGYNDGPVWAGRGVTTAFQGGVSARYGRASVVIAPVVSYAQNAGFDLAETGYTGRLRFADPGRPQFIDLPQRFGDGAVTRIDPGQSTARLDLPGVTLGVSTANQQWGPAVENPYLLGNNAPGFLHAFVGTSAPVNIWIGRIHGRAIWGKLDQSEYSPVEGSGSRRFMSGLVAVFTPRGIPGLELGGGRFFHTPWSDGGLEARDFFGPLQSFYLVRNAGSQTQDSENQLASLFARWVLPRSGLEVYGEFGKEDRNADFRDLLLEPEHNGGYLLGFRKAWALSPSHLIAFRGEAFNSQISHVVRTRNQSPPYFHASVRQGHTHRGQILGSAWGYGGGASVVAADYYHRHGRWSVNAARLIRAEGFYLDEQSQIWDPKRRDPKALDLLHVAGIETVHFVGRFDLTAGFRGVYNSNRHFGTSLFNWNASFGVRAGI